MVAGRAHTIILLSVVVVTKILLFFFSSCSYSRACNLCVYIFFFILYLKFDVERTNERTIDLLSTTKQRNFVFYTHWLCAALSIHIFHVFCFHLFFNFSLLRALDTSKFISMSILKAHELVAFYSSVMHYINKIFKCYFCFY